MLLYDFILKAYVYIPYKYKKVYKSLYNQLTFNDIAQQFPKFLPHESNLCGSREIFKLDYFPSVQS